MRGGTEHVLGGVIPERQGTMNSAPSKVTQHSFRVGNVQDASRVGNIKTFCEAETMGAGVLAIRWFICPPCFECDSIILF
jgi:hypothetical protein